MAGAAAPGGPPGLFDHLHPTPQVVPGAPYAQRHLQMGRVLARSATRHRIRHRAAADAYVAMGFPQQDATTMAGLDMADAAAASAAGTRRERLRQQYKGTRFATERERFRRGDDLPPSQWDEDHGWAEPNVTPDDPADETAFRMAFHGMYLGSRDLGQVAVLPQYCVVIMQSPARDEQAKQIRLMVCAYNTHDLMGRGAGLDLMHTVSEWIPSADTKMVGRIWFIADGNLFLAEEADDPARKILQQGQPVNVKFDSYIPAALLDGPTKGVGIQLWGMKPMIFSLAEGKLIPQERRIVDVPGQSLFEPLTWDVMAPAHHALAPVHPVAAAAAAAAPPP